MSLKSATQKETNRIELDIEVDAATFEAAVNKAYKKNIGRMSVPGFRKGKAPRHLVEKMYGEGVFYEDAMNDVYPSALDAAVIESGYEYVEDKIDLDVVSVGKDGLNFKAVITVKPEVQVGKYKGLKAAKKAEPVTDEDIDGELKKLQERNSRLVTAEGRPAAEGDTVTFDFDGYVDGQPFDGGLHHFPAARGVQVGHMHAQPREVLHRLADGVGDVVQLEVEKDAVAALEDAADHIRACGVVQLHSDLHIRSTLPEFIKKRHRLFFAAEITSNDYIFTHYAHLRLYPSTLQYHTFSSLPADPGSHSGRHTDPPD